MTNVPATFRQIDVTRAIKGAQAAGLEVAQFVIDKSGNIVVVAKGEAVATPSTDIDKMLGMK